MVFAILLLIFQAYIIFTVVILLLDNREPAETFAWIFLFIFLPVLGFILYLMAGRNWKRSYGSSKLPQYIAKHLVELFKPYIDIQAEAIASMKSKSAVYQDDLMTLLWNNSHSMLTMDNQVKVYHHAKEKFEDLIEDIKSAKTFIHMEYFIWYSNDILGQKLKALLIDKVRQGVEVRILYDFSGCFYTLSRAYIKELRKEGIQIYPFFNYLSFFKFHTFNYRNHRKIVVIDGTLAYTGGMNVGQEYIDGGKKYKFWRDTHMRLTGESVNILQAVFAIDWYNTVHQENIFDVKYYPFIPLKVDLKGDLPLQFPTSGYDSPWPAIMHLYFSLITMSQKNIYIVSPYFIPESSLLVALRTASMRGVKVVVLMTGVIDNPLPYWAASSYFEELLEAGVRIFQYKRGFMHAKMVTIDGRICSIGTANFDIRSLRLNYEINAVFYNGELTKQTDDQILIDLSESVEVTRETLKRASVWVRLRSSVTRLISPLL